MEKILLLNKEHFFNRSKFRLNSIDWHGVGHLEKLDVLQTLAAIVIYVLMHIVVMIACRKIVANYELYYVFSRLRFL